MQAKAGATLDRRRSGSAERKIWGAIVPVYDRKCGGCGDILLDCYEPPTAPNPDCKVCGGVMARVWLPGKANSVIGDEIDVEIKHGLCAPDGSPRRFRSRSELRQAEKAAGWVNRVEHLGTKGGDRSKHTTRWI
jgi:hypothetical protein